MNKIRKLSDNHDSRANDISVDIMCDENIENSTFSGSHVANTENQECGRNHSPKRNTCTRKSRDTSALSTYSDETGHSSLHECKHTLPTNHPCETDCHNINCVDNVSYYSNSAYFEPSDISSVTVNSNPVENGEHTKYSCSHVDNHNKSGNTQNLLSTPDGDIRPTVSAITSFSPAVTTIKHCDNIQQNSISITNTASSSIMAPFSSVNMNTVDNCKINANAKGYSYTAADLAIPNAEKKWPSSTLSDTSDSSAERTGKKLIPMNIAVQVTTQSHLLAKLVFVASMVTIVVLAYGLLMIHWLLPYYYAISAPILIAIRIPMYCKNKWQYFLIDFCYFSNVGVYMYLWGWPHSQNYFCVIFGITAGPLLWAVALFRNSIVLHNIDKMTSAFIHLLPAFLTFSIRWYPESISQHWYRDFVTNFDLDFYDSLIWIAAIPFALFFLHSIAYIIFVYVMMNPNEEYLNSYRFLSSKSPFNMMTSICGPKYQFIVYHLLYWLYGLIAVSLAIVWYHYYVAHVVFLIFICLVGIWNGASYYVDVFSVRGFSSE